MITYNTKLGIEAAVNEYVDARKMFTAGEIIAHVRSQDPNAKDRYAPMRDHIHAMFDNGEMGGDYERTSVAFPTSKGIEVALVYHPDDADPRKYESHELRKAAAAATPPKVAPSADDFFGLIDTGAPPPQFPAPVGNFFTGNPVPPAPPVAPEPPPVLMGMGVGSLAKLAELKLKYTTDPLGQVVLGKDCTSKLVGNQFEAIYAYPERKRVTLLNTNDALAANVSMLMLDGDWNVAIPLYVLNRAGLDGKPLKVVFEDDAIYLTEAK